MRNLIFKTVFATILTSLSLAPLAHADRQGGGGMMKVAFSAPDLTSAEWVRFKGIDSGKVSFDYAWVTNSNRGVENLTISREDFNEQTASLVQALQASKNTLEWALIPPKSSN